MRQKWIMGLAVASILMIGCGGGSSSKKESVDSILSKSDAVATTPSGIDFNNKTSLRLKQYRKLTKKLSKTQKIFQKGEAQACSQSGTYSMEETSTQTTITYNECIYYDNSTHHNVLKKGKISQTKDEKEMKFDNYFEVSDYDNYPNIGSHWHIVVKFDIHDTITQTYLDGDMKTFDGDIYTEEAEFSGLTMKENSKNNTLFIDGGYSYHAGCIKEFHKYTTKDGDWLVMNPNSDNMWSGGTLYIDNATYHYQNEDVDVKKKGKRGKFKQIELINELLRKKNSTDCQ